jgi:hypothetical protein
VSEIGRSDIPPTGKSTKHISALAELMRINAEASFAIKKAIKFSINEVVLGIKNDDL